MAALPPPDIHFLQLFNWGALGAVAIISVAAGSVLQWFIAKRQAALQEAIAARQAQLQEQIAKRQVADSIAGRRQAWIDALRSELAEFLALAESVSDLDVRRHSEDITPEVRLEIIERQTERMLRGIHLKATIALRLNVNEVDHVLLGDALDAMSDELNKTDRGAPIDRQNLRSLHQPTVDKARALLKKEWNRVKSGDV